MGSLHQASHHTATAVVMIQEPRSTAATSTAADLHPNHNISSLLTMVVVQEEQEQEQQAEAKPTLTTALVNPANNNNNNNLVPAANNSSTTSTAIPSKESEVSARWRWEVLLALPATS